MDNEPVTQNKEPSPEQIDEMQRREQQQRQRTADGVNEQDDQKLTADKPNL